MSIFSFFLKSQGINLSEDELVHATTHFVNEGKKFVAFVVSSLNTINSKLDAKERILEDIKDRLQELEQRNKNNE